MISNSWNIISNLYGNIHFFPMTSIIRVVAGFDWIIDQMVSSGEVLVLFLINDTNGGRVQPTFVFRKIGMHSLLMHKCYESWIPFRSSGMPLHVEAYLVADCPHAGRACSL